MTRIWALALVFKFAAYATPTVAQEREGPLLPDGGKLDLDIRSAMRQSSADEALIERCEKEAEAARITGEIIVCRSLGEGTDGAWDARDFEQRYAEATQGTSSPDVDGTGVRLPSEGSLVAITVTLKPGNPPPPPLMIDVEALPDAPPGSDADRVANGLPAKAEQP